MRTTEMTEPTDDELVMMAASSPYREQIKEAIQAEDFLQTGMHLVPVSVPTVNTMGKASSSSLAASVAGTSVDSGSFLIQKHGDR
jgi:hypothetical protein